MVAATASADAIQGYLEIPYRIPTPHLRTVHHFLHWLDDWQHALETNRTMSEIAGLPAFYGGTNQEPFIFFMRQLSELYDSASPNERERIKNILVGNANLEIPAHPALLMYISDVGTGFLSLTEKI